MARPTADLPYTFRLVPLVLRWLGSRGVSENARAATLEGLPADAATATVITAPLGRVQAFMTRAAEVAREPSLGLALCAATPRGTYSLLEFIARASPTVREAMLAVGRYYRLLNEGAQFGYVERAGVGALEFRVLNRPDGWGRHLNEFTYAFLHRVSAELVPDWRLSRVWFSHPAPPAAASQALAAYFGVRPTFGQSSCGFEAPRELVQRPLSTAEPSLFEYLGTQAEAALAQQTRLAQLSAKTRDEVCRQLGRGEVTIQSVASTLALSPRTLQRKLKEEGTSFLAVLDGVREQFARAHLKNPALTVSEVAYLVGYSELRAFDRAFRRWAGQTPLEYRKAALRG